MARHTPIIMFLPPHTVSDHGAIVGHTGAPQGRVAGAVVRRDRYAEGLMNRRLRRWPRRRRRGCARIRHPRGPSTERPPRRGPGRGPPPGQHRPEQTRVDAGRGRSGGVVIVVDRLRAHRREEQTEEGAHHRHLGRELSAVAVATPGFEQGGRHHVGQCGTEPGHTGRELGVGSWSIMSRTASPAAVARGLPDRVPAWYTGPSGASTAGTSARPRRRRSATRRRSPSRSTTGRG